MNHAICLGEILIDCFSQQPGLPRSEVTDWVPLPGGASASIACALARLGNSVEFVGAVGKDRWGGALVKLLTDMQVGSQGVQYRLKAPTREVYVTQDEQGHSAFAGFSESDPAIFADAHLFSGALAEDSFKDACVLVLGALSLAYPDTGESVQEAVRLAGYHNLWIMVDVNWRPMFWSKPAEAPGRIYDLLQKTHFLKVSTEEANWLFGTVSAKAIAHQLPHLKGVLVTDAVKGCEYCFHADDGEFNGKVTGFVVDIEDAAGASEAFTAGFVHQLMQKGINCMTDEDTAHRTVTYASATSALTMTRPGAIAALPTPNEIEVFLYLN
ncbi:MAG: carbohydrate kinase [Phormidesmis sp.]